jgi:hypothetical protein
MIFIFLPPGRPDAQWPGSAPLLALRATWVYPAVMTVVARPDNFTQVLDTLNRQLRMGVLKMGWISKTTVQELDCVRQCSSSFMSRSFLSMPGPR